MKEEVDEDEVYEEEAVKQSLLEKAEVSLLLDTYDDIFSDFDPRHYSQRSLSDDFLIEARKAAIDKEGGFELHFLIPKAVRRLEQENLIKKRLREHFKRHASLLENEISRIKRQGLFLIISGIIMMFMAVAFYSGLISVNELIKTIILVITEPAGWFLFWIGGEKIVYERREKMPELNFYRKMTHANIVFISY